MTSCSVIAYHDWLLSPAVDLLPSLLLPLAGPEEFDEDDMEKLPVELQYLEPEKTREPMAIVRANLVESLIQVLYVFSVLHITACSYLGNLFQV